MTQEGHEALQEELRNLKSVERPAIVKAIAAAREHGDLSENAEYHAARERQSFIEGRIGELEDYTKRAEIIDTSKLKGKTVRFGAKVKLVDEVLQQFGEGALVRRLLQQLVHPPSQTGIEPRAPEVGDGLGRMRQFPAGQPFADQQADGFGDRHFLGRGNMLVATHPAALFKCRFQIVGDARHAAAAERFDPGLLDNVENLPGDPAAWHRLHVGDVIVIAQSERERIRSAAHH